MSKAPKAKKAALHYQPYQALGQASDVDEASMDLNMFDPVLSGLSSSMSRNLWDDWNENDANFGMKFDMFADEVSTASTASSTASPNPGMHVPHGEVATSSFGHMSPSPYEQQQNASPNPMHGRGVGGGTPTHEDQHKPRANVQRSLSEDIVNMLDDSNEASYPKQMETDAQRRDVAMQHNMMFNSASGQSFQQHQSNQQQHHQQQQQEMHSNHLHQFQQQQMQIQQQLQQQYQQPPPHQQPFQQATGPNASSWMNNFGGGGSQSSATATTTASVTPSSNSTAHRRPSNPSPLDIAVAEGTASLVAKCPASHAPATSAASTPLAPAPASQQSTVPKGKVTGAQAGVAAKSNNAPGVGSSSSNGASMNDPSQQANAFGGMMMNPFMMYSMMGPQGMNMMGMPMAMPMGMNMNGMTGANDVNGSSGTNEASAGNGNSMNGMNGMNAMAGMNGMQLPMQLQLQLQLQMQMQMAQMAQMNGMGGMNGMQMPMGLPGMPMGMNMPMPLNMNMQQQQVNPQSGLAGDVEMTPAAAATAFPMGMPTSGGPTLKPARPLLPKGAPRTGPAFVSIARKPEEPEVSSILKSLMDEEAKKKEKKLERNRDSARESRRKQQTYVETLENGIKRLQINRDLVRSYRWGVSGPGFGPLPCPNSPQMFDWKNRLEVVTGRTEAFSSIQNPANFQSLMRLNRQRRTLAMQQLERERAVWKCFVFLGRQLAAMRTRVLQVQMLRTFSENPLAMELDAVLNLTADQKLQLQCHAQQTFNEEVVELTKLFKVFFALRNEALRLNLMSPSLERHFRDACSFDQLQKLLQWTETHRSVIETDLCLDEV